MRADPWAQSDPNMNPQFRRRWRPPDKRKGGPGGTASSDASISRNEGQTIADVARTQYPMRLPCHRGRAP
jgi:hypothetical protein